MGGQESKLSQSDALILGYWATMIRLLQLGIPWDSIQEMSLPQIMVVMNLAASMLEADTEKKYNAESTYDAMAAYHGGI